jgi:hypothetical protein
LEYFEKTQGFLGFALRLNNAVFGFEEKRFTTNNAIKAYERGLRARLNRGGARSFTRSYTEEEGIGFGYRVIARKDALSG